ncbi:alpha/beta fold hydrolase [Serratia entomophila]|uniref:alpha/beta fold hydrolase n=1 Tax=Serratia entomophila TaxID=42906 RepID=UPI00217A1174|nr:alpha/beta hydrolase [Serratia entomophila]CAI1878266.1 Tropinesterase [Serratia entomophila]
MIRETQHHEKIKLSCGTCINVTSWGKHAAPACLLIHGLDNNTHIWDTIATELSESFRVYTIDIRGHGESDWANSNSYTLSTLINDIEQVRAYLSLSDFIMIGHSLGGRIATYYTAEYPKYVKKLVLIDMAPEIGKNIIEKLQSDSRSQPENFPNIQSCYTYMQSIYPLSNQSLLYNFCQHSFTQKNGYYTNKTDPAFKHKMFQLSDQEGYINPLQDEKIWDALPQISIPTLIIRGGFSAVLSSQIANKMARDLPNANISIIERAGHAVMLDNPQQTAHAILNFI